MQEKLTNVFLCLMLGFVFLFHPSSASACSIAEVPEPRDTFNRADAVFKGKVISVTTNPDPQYTNLENPVLNYKAVVEISKYWKGDVKKYIRIFGRSGYVTSCDTNYLPKVGDEFSATYADFHLSGEYSLLGIFSPPIEDTLEFLERRRSKVPEDMENPYDAPVVEEEYLYQYTQDLKQGMTSLDVKKLQKFLNIRGFVIASTGPGSPGNETEYFGSLTKDALVRFQNQHKQELGITSGTGFLGPITRSFILAKYRPYN